MESREEEKGILLVNLGSPNSTDVPDVRAYLDEFLMDKHVIDIPYPLRALLVKGIILRTRPPKSAEKYKTIWTPEGSPLIVLSEKLANKVQTITKRPVALAMRYGQPSIEAGLQELVLKGVKEVTVLPLYPQYAMATTESIIEKTENIRKKRFPDLNITYTPAFYHKKVYIDALSKSVADQLSSFDYDHLLFSYHGIPERHIRKSDITRSHCKIDGSCCQTPSSAHEFCYRHQCYATTRLLIEKLQLDESKVTTSFQSRLGQQKWLQPYTTDAVEKLALKGIKKLAIITPAFVTDCLETLEEIGMEAKEQFLELGGNEFLALKCLNDDDVWAKAVVSILENGD